MSNNPWPFVVVALLSLGFLANSMAQQDGTGSAFTPGSTANQDFGADGEPGQLPDFKLPRARGIAKDNSDSENRWVTNDPAPIPPSDNESSDETAPPIFTTKPQARLGQATAASGDSLTANTSASPALTNFPPPVARLLPANVPTGSETESTALPSRPNVAYGNYEDTFSSNRPFKGYRDIGADSRDSRDRTPFSVAQNDPPTEQAQLGAPIEDDYYGVHHESPRVAQADNAVKFGVPEANAPAATYRQPNLRKELPNDFASTSRKRSPSSYR